MYAHLLSIFRYLEQINFRLSELVACRQRRQLLNIIQVYMFVQVVVQYCRINLIGLLKHNFDCFLKCRKN